MSHGLGTVVGEMKLSSIPPGRELAGYVGLTYKPYLLEEKWDNGKFQRLVGIPKYQILIDKGEWTDGTATSYIPVPDGGGGSLTYKMSARFITYYYYGTWVLQINPKEEPTPKFQGWYQEEDIPETEVIEEKDDAGHVIGKTRTVYEKTGEENTIYEENAYESPEGSGNWYVDVEQPAQKGDKDAYESPVGSGNWYVKVQEYADSYTEYGISSKTYTYIFVEKSDIDKDIGEQEISAVKTIEFFPGPAKFRYELANTELKMYIDKGVTSLFTNFFDYQKYASQYIAWRKQEKSQCPEFSGEYLNAENLNNIMFEVNETNPYSKGERVTTETFTTLTNAINY